MSTDTRTRETTTAVAEAGRRGRLASTVGRPATWVLQDRAVAALTGCSLAFYLAFSLTASCVRLLLVREAMGILVALIGAILWVREGHRVGSWWRTVRTNSLPPRLVTLFVIGGAAAFVVSTMMIVPAMSPIGHYPYWQFGGIGANFPEAIKTVVTAPWRVVQVFFTPGVKATTFVALVGPVLWYPLRSPYVVLAV